jgi:hypothetical protein
MEEKKENKKMTSDQKAALAWLYLIPLYFLVMTLYQIFF